MSTPSLFECLRDHQVKCLACEHHCLIDEGKVGRCGVRKNVGGKLKLMVYGKPVDVALDPVEKKPLYHFLPGCQVLSLGTYGCNLACDFCQNWQISQASKTTHIDSLIEGDFLSPEEVVEYAVKKSVPAIAYTYNEPTVFFEYAYDIGVLARQKGVRNVFVTNGFFSDQVFELLKDFLDAANVDLKSFSDEFYLRRCQARLQPVLRNIRRLWQAGVWVEVTTLVITGENDSYEELKQIARFIASISRDVPWHVTRFSPAYKMGHVPTTSFAKIRDAVRLGREAGLRFVYPGNMGYGERTTTVCPSCKKEVLIRNLFTVSKYALGEKGDCDGCGFRIPGIWK